MLVTYACNYSDLNEYGICISFNNDTVYYSDDNTDSYQTWNMSYMQIFEELYTCWKKRVKSKKYTYEAYEFERSLGEKLDLMTRQIMERSWKPRGYKDFYIYHPKRLISSPIYEDRIVEAWLTDKFIIPMISPMLHDNNMACQKGKGPVMVQKYLKYTLSSLYKKFGNDFMFFKTDMQGYYSNLSHDEVKKITNNMQALGRYLLLNIINDWHDDTGYAVQNNPDKRYGIPKGNLPSQWIGLYYLNELDWIISHRDDCLGYVRFMDDLIVFFKTKQSCKDCKIKTEKFLTDKQMGIRLHPAKTYYSTISKGFTFCGFRYTILKDGNIRVSIKNETKKYTKAKFKKIQKEYNNDDLTFEQVKAKLNGTYAHLKQCDSKQFRRYLSYRYTFTKEKE